MSALSMTFVRKHIISPSTLVSETRPLVLVGWGCRLSMGEVDEQEVAMLIPMMMKTMIFMVMMMMTGRTIFSLRFEVLVNFLHIGRAVKSPFFIWFVMKKTKQINILGNGNNFNSGCRFHKEAWAQWSRG